MWYIVFLKQKNTSWHMCYPPKNVIKLVLGLPKNCQNTAKTANKPFREKANIQGQKAGKDRGR